MSNFFSSFYKKNRKIKRIQRPIFIIGCGRSGTKLLCDLIKTHPDIRETQGSPDGEDHVGWIKHGKAIISGLGSTPEISRGHTGFDMCLSMDESHVNNEIIKEMHNYYSKTVLKGDYSKRIINKNPHLSNKLRYVKSIFPDAKFIHIIRDCLSVVASWKKIMTLQNKQVIFLPDNKWPCLWVLDAPEDENRDELFKNEKIFPGGGGVTLLAEYWIQINKNIEEQCIDFMDQLKVVRYEDLIDRPDAILKDLYSFCDLPGKVIINDHIYKNTDKKHQHLLCNNEIQTVLRKSKKIRHKFGYI